MPSSTPSGLSVLGGRGFASNIKDQDATEASVFMRAMSPPICSKRTRHFAPTMQPPLQGSHGHSIGILENATVGGRVEHATPGTVLWTPSLAPTGPFAVDVRLHWNGSTRVARERRIERC